MEFNARTFADEGVSGVDLTFCKMALEAHHAQVVVTSETGTGTSFSFQLPLGSPQHMID